MKILQHLGGVFFGCLIVVALFVVPVHAQILIEGPGNFSFSPLNVPLNNTNGPTRAIYVLQNIGPDAVFVVPQVQCPDNKILASFFQSAIEIPEKQTRQFQIGFTAINTNVSVNEIIGCLISVGNSSISVFLQITERSTNTPTGSLDTLIKMIPENRDTEAVEFFFDPVTVLSLNLSFSGLAFRSELGFGVTGPEFVVLDNKAFLGLIEFRSVLVFASAFDVQNQLIVPAGVSQSLNFIKKRIEIDFDLFGLSVQNLAIFENTKFTYPFTSIAQGLDAIQSPAFRFGNLLQISGFTEFGLPLRLLIGLCADPTQPNIIKNKAFATSACETEPFTFTVANLSLGPFRLDNIQLSSTVDFRPHIPLNGTLSARVPVFGIAQLGTTFTFVSNALTAGVSVITLAQPEQTLLVQVNPDFTLKSIFLRLRGNLDDQRFSVAFRSDENLFRSLSASVSLPLPLGQLTALAVFTGVSDLQFNQVSLNWTQSFDNASVQLRTLFALSGLTSAEANISLFF